MRVRLSKRNLSKLFKGVLNKRSISDVASILKKNRRTIQDWEKGVLTMPVDAFKLLLKISNYPEKKLYPVFLSNFWHAEVAGKKGGIERNKLYGNFGTRDGRIKGGLNSIMKHV